MLMACAGGQLLRAQEQQTEAGKEQFREIPSPEKNARRETERMKKELGLTEKQYNKVYKLLLKLERKRFLALTGGNSNMSFPAMGEAPGEGGGGRPPMGGGGGMGPGMGGGRPPMGGGGPGRRPMMNQNSAESLQKAEASTDKKIKKILSEEQFAKWQEMRKPQEPPRRPKGERPPHPNGEEQPL
ncbi:MAG: DUF4890 domain-containing protein [Bacteroides sp.]|nr:DUF4890 domain-containing protein [Bacteroides sp.]